MSDPIPWEQRSGAGPRMGIRNRLLLWTVGVTGALLIAVIAWNYLNVLTRLEEEARDRASFLAAGSAEMIDARLGPIQGLIRGLALGLEIHALDLSFAAVRDLLFSTLRDHPEIYGSTVALLPILIVFLLFQRQIIESVALTGSKS